MTHTVTTHLGSCYFNATLITDDTLIAYTLILATVALPVLSRTKDTLTEEPVTLGLEGAIVDRLRLSDLPV